MLLLLLVLLLVLSLGAPILHFLPGTGLVVGGLGLVAVPLLAGQPGLHQDEGEACGIY